MISVIVCSRDANRLAILKESIAHTIGVAYELVVVDNVENKYSIFSAYNEGIRKSSYPFLCFVHEDVRFVTRNWGEKIMAHLLDENTGLVGVAGGGAMPKIPSTWSLVGKSYNLIQAGKKDQESKVVQCPEMYPNKKRQVVVLDGVFLVMRRELSDELIFDEKFTGFHGYDYDISAQSIVAGYKNYVVYDVLLEHFSAGNQNIAYYRQLIRVYEKWEHYLPLLADTVHGNSIDEVHNLNVMIRCMIAVGFDKKEIRYNINNFKTRLDLNWSDGMLLFKESLYRIIVACSNLKWRILSKIS